MSIGPKIIEGLKQAIAGDFARVTIEGQTWIRADQTYTDTCKNPKCPRGGKPLTVILED